MNSFILPLDFLKGGCPGPPAGFEFGPNSVCPRDFVKTPHDKISKYSTGNSESDGAHIMASGGAGTHTSGTLHHKEKRNLHGYKTILDVASDRFLDHVLGWNVESLTCFITTYEGLCTSYACGAL